MSVTGWHGDRLAVGRNSKVFEQLALNPVKPVPDPFRITGKPPADRFSLAHLAFDKLTATSDKVKIELPFSKMIRKYSALDAFTK